MEVGGEMEKYQICSLQCLDGNDDVIEYPEGKVRFNKDTKWPRPTQMLASKQSIAGQLVHKVYCTVLHSRVPQPSFWNILVRRGTRLGVPQHTFDPFLQYY